MNRIERQELREELTEFLQDIGAPWTLSQSDNSVVLRERKSIDGTGRKIGLSEMCDCKGYLGERIASARLTAAAPELMQALVEAYFELLHINENAGGHGQLIEQIETALRKASEK